MPQARAAGLLDEALFPPPAAGGPDTTASWRYFPLHHGDAWEYYEYHTGDIIRHVVTGDTVRDGRRYFVLAAYLAAGGQSPEFSQNYYLRFDTLNARVLEPYVGGERPPFTLAPCRLDMPWGTIANCGGGLFMSVSGGYDRQLVFGGEFPGTGTDTVTVAGKRYAHEIVTFEFRYAADFGLVYQWIDDGVYELGITFSRVDGVAHGVERFPNIPTAPEGGAPGRGALALAVSPNPARGAARAAFVLDRPAEVAAEVYDALGRRVIALDLGHLSPGRHDAALDFGGLAPGAYVVRLSAREAERSHTTARRLTLLR